MALVILPPEVFCPINAPSHFLPPFLVPSLVKHLDYVKAIWERGPHPNVAIDFGSTLQNRFLPDGFLPVMLWEGSAEKQTINIYRTSIFCFCVTCVVQVQKTWQAMLHKVYLYAKIIPPHYFVQVF